MPTRRALSCGVGCQSCFFEHLIGRPSKSTVRLWDGSHRGTFSKPSGIAGGRDKLADPTDVRALAAALLPGVVVAAHEEPSYEHMDFCWGDNAHELVYSRVLDLLGAYT